MIHNRGKYNSSEIKTLSELMSEIEYSLNDGYPLREAESGVYVLNKLVIAPDFVQYKMETHKLHPQVYSDFLTLIKMVKEM